MLILLRQRTKTSGWRLTVPDQIFYVTRDSIFFFLSVVDSSINVQKRATKVVERLRCYFKRDVKRDTIPPLSYTPKTFTAVWLYRRRWSPLLFDCHQENGQGNTFGATLKGGKTQMFRVVQQPASQLAADCHATWHFHMISQVLLLVTTVARGGRAAAGWDHTHTIG